MFSSELDRARYPFVSRARGIVLGTLIVIAVVASLVSARTLAFSFGAIVAAFLVAAAARGELRQAIPARGHVARQLAFFLLYALVSAAWAVQPATSLGKTCLALLIAGGTFAVVQLMATETRANLLHLGEGLCVGLGIGLGYLLIELLTNQSMEIWLFNAIGAHPGDLHPANFFGWSGDKLVGISRDVLSRNIAPAAFLLWPAVLIILGAWSLRWRTYGAVAAVVLTVAVIALSSHETSKLAVVVGLAAFACAVVSLPWAARITAVGWVVACLAVVPAALIAHRLDLHNATWLQTSARHRIIIWNFTAEKSLESPLLGTGANMTYVLGPRLEREVVNAPDESLRRTLSVHSHSVYLQTWSELGLVGAALLTLVGLSILQAIKSLAPALQPYAYATFATAAAEASSSYGMWQTWFMALFGLCAVAFSLGCRLFEQRNGGSRVEVASEIGAGRSRRS